jgi:hypothetical protein
VDRALVGVVPVRGQRLAVDLVPVRAGGEVRQRPHALVERAAARLVEPRDHVRQARLLGGAVEAGRQPVADRGGGADH